jgi:hypothetical protein
VNSTAALIMRSARARARRLASASANPVVPKRADSFRSSWR